MQKQEQRRLANLAKVLDENLEEYLHATNLRH
jgi:hypothetical protein